MIYKKVSLSSIDERFKNQDSFLEIYSLADRKEEPIFRKRPGMLIIPGGGYEFVSLREGEPLALRYLSEGFTCFVLTYSINKKYPQPQSEVALVMNYINSHCEELNIYPNSTSVMGFSAGGHLAGSYSYLYKELAKEYGFNETYCRPFTTTLGYPVISFVNPTHDGTKNVITGGDPLLIEKLSVEKHVDGEYPPTFIFTTREDTCVPPINSEVMAEALHNAKVDFEFEYYEHGWHGLSLMNRSVNNFEGVDKINFENGNWVEKNVRFIYSHLDSKFPL